MWSAFVPERNFRTGTRTGVNSYRYDYYRCGISYRYHVNKYRATSGNRDELVPGMKVIPVSCKHPLTVLLGSNSVADLGINGNWQGTQLGKVGGREGGEGGSFVPVSDQTFRFWYPFTSVLLLGSIHGSGDVTHPSSLELNLN